MKRLIVILAFVAFSKCAIAQWSTTTGGISYSGGSVGIGTTSPVQPLDVTGTGGGLSGTAKVNAIFTQDHTTYRGVLLGYDSGGQTGVIAPSTTSSGSNLAFWNYNGSAWQESMRISQNGFVGIGTVSPGCPLQVTGSSLLVNLSNNLDQDIQFYLTAPGASNKYALIAPSTNSSLAFGVYGTEKMRVTPAGNLLIGKTSQINTSYMLDVNGNARANAVYVNTTGADFVFDKNYALRPLSYVQRYINENHHLPDVPSAQEMQTNGLNLGDNQIKLLQKVEELTLYLIDRDKQVASLQQQLDTQKIKSQAEELRIERLEKLVNTLTSNQSDKQ